MVHISKGGKEGTGHKREGSQCICVSEGGKEGAMLLSFLGFGISCFAPHYEDFLGIDTSLDTAPFAELWRLPTCLALY